mmetsp:Transcript_26440/g.42989  ORF Transcript_26440/g.42989 Transcript_26440/m.42989 type:complete len:88 (+) Transcript_26440:211-474(+)
MYTFINDRRLFRLSRPDQERPPLSNVQVKLLVGYLEGIKIASQVVVHSLHDSGGTLVMNGCCNASSGRILRFGSYVNMRSIMSTKLS